MLIGGDAASREALDIRAYRPEDEAPVLDLLEAAFGSWPQTIEGPSPAEFFRWKHMESPFGPSILLVAESGDGAIIGLIAYLRWRLGNKGQTLEALRVVDLAVHPEHRRRGLFMELGNRGRDHFPPEVALTFSLPNRQSKGGSKKLGPSQIGTVSRFLRPRRAASGWLSLAARQWSGREGRDSPPVEAESAADVLADAEGVSSLLSVANDSTDWLATDKDLDYLRWRYGSLVPYRAIRVEREGRLAGLAIFRVRRWDRLWVTVLCELLVAPDDRRLARSLLKHVVKAAPVDCLLCGFPAGTRSRKTVVRSLFVRMPNAQPLLVRPIRKDIASELTNRDSWALGFGDQDLL